MIKNLKKYWEKNERERAKFLRNLTYEESARMMESLLSSGIFSDIEYPPRPLPVSLRQLIRKRCQKSR